MAASESLQVYRRLLRSASQVFKGDIIMLSAARQEIRNKLEISRSVTDLEKLKELRAEGLEAADFLKTAVIQAEKNTSGNFEMAVNADQVNSYVEPIEQGMSLPREKKNKNKKE